jgi:phage tail-like protein
MPYEYPGDYAMRFDGVAEPAAYFKRLSPSLVELRPSSVGTFKFQELTVASPRAGMLLTQWYRANTTAGGPAKNLVIELLNNARLPVARWRVRNARPVKWVMSTAQARGEVAIETLEIAHEGMLRG